MIYNKLFLNIIIRILLIAITCLSLSYFLFRFDNHLVVANLVFIFIALLAIQSYLFLRSINITNYNLEKFFKSLENNDTSVSFKYEKGYLSYQKLMERMNMIKQKINNLRMENERQFQYFKAVVENVGIGLMVFQPEGKMEVLNEAGGKILNIPHINNLSQLDQHFEGLSERLMNLSSKQQVMYRLNISNNLVPVSFKVNDYRFFDHSIRLISFQNIKNELDAQELESWQKLIRVLTHEIMNSTGPITSSIDTIKEFLIDENSGKEKGITELNQETIQDVLRGISIIKERSVGLSEFIRNFRNLTQNHNLRPDKFSVFKLFNDLKFLLNNELISKQINLRIAVLPENLEFFADRKLIEQVIMNLIYNSIDALKGIDDKIIQLKAFADFSNHYIIQVVDNGKGIPEEIMDKIFIPFFTTHEEGSGIGLSLSRQIMQLHQGTISVKSIPDKETIFELTFIS